MAKKTTKATTRAVVKNQFVRIDDCRPHPENYNQHDDSQIEDLRESLRQFGQVRSIVAQASGKGFLLVAGHGLCQAARLEGIRQLRADVIPALWSKTKVLAYLAADNELARRGNPDEAQLAAIVKRVHEAEGEALARLAAGEKAALDRLLAQANGQDDGIDAEPQIDRAEELRKKWGVELGQLWALDEHRLICGDCTDRAVVERVMGGGESGHLFYRPTLWSGNRK